jgi:hypothetical protein
MRIYTLFFLNLFIIGTYAQTFTDSNIPIVIIDTHGATIVDEPKISADFKIINNSSGLRNYLTDLPSYSGKIGIEIRGNFSAILPQLSYGFELRDSVGSDVDTTLLGMPAEHDWHLIANYNDKSFSRNTLAGELFRKLGNYAPRSKFCEVLIDGDYKGVYLLSESIKRDKNRVHISKLDSAEITSPDVTGGYIIKNDYWTPTDSWQSSFGPPGHPSADVHLVYHYPKPDNIQPAQKAYIQGFINQFETSLYSPTFSDPITGFRQYADETSFIDYFIINELSRNYDGFMHSFYFNKDRDGASPKKLKCGPVWDFDWAFNNIYVSNCIDFAATDGSGWAYLINDCSVHSVNSVGWHIRMLQDNAFRDLLRCRWYQSRQTFMSTAEVFSHVDSVATYLNEAQGRHYARWGHIANDVGGCHELPIPGTFAGHVTQMKDWLSARMAWLDSNMPGTLGSCVTGISETKTLQQSIIIFPIPANDLLFIETTEPEEIISITCYDQQGSLVMDLLNLHTKTQSLNVAELSAGLYILKINVANGKQLYSKLTIAH